MTKNTFTQEQFIKELALACEKGWNFRQFSDYMISKYGEHSYSNQYYSIHKKLREKIKTAKTITKSTLQKYQTQLTLTKSVDKEKKDIFSIIHKVLVLDKKRTK